MLRLLRFVAVSFVAAVVTARACTIFVLTDAHQTLFCNNEDWFNRATRVWFVPAGRDHLGCAFIGFDDGWAQGGVNSAGLAFDWVSGLQERYTPDAALLSVRGNPSERMLETCRTVADAVAFYRKFREPDFSRSRILVADRSGASAVIGARDGRLHVELRQENRGMGYGRAILDRDLTKTMAATLANGSALLRACNQPGEGGTKYANVFNLTSGEITLLPDPLKDGTVVLDLARELARGAHSYDIPKIRTQLAEPVPLLPNQQRFYLDGFPPIADPDPAFTARLARLLRDAATGKWEESDFVNAFWREIASARKSIEADLSRLGQLQSLTLVKHSRENGEQTNRYIAKFEHAHVLARYVIRADGKIAGMQNEFVERVLN